MFAGRKEYILMRIFLEAGSGFSKGTDAYGREIVGSAESDAVIKSCAEFLSSQKEILDQKIEVLPIKDALANLEEIKSEDLLISVHLNLYSDPSGEGLRGFYRSSRKHNSEKCKALAITVTKGLHDHIDLYYHGVYNEQRAGHPQLEPVVHAKGLAALVEIGFKEAYRNRVSDPMLARNVGEGIGKGIVRHLSALH
jgi:hypothetical protein